MEPLQVLFVIPKQPPPRLKEPKKWSPDFLDFIEKCLQKEPGARATAKELLMVIIEFGFSDTFFSIRSFLRVAHHKFWNL
jgi:serine/threonine protein kinase